MNRFRNQRGQALVVTVVFMTVLVGMAALAIDVGHWYHTQRKLQAVADSAALAAAQDLPTSTATATATANAYAKQNGGALASVSFSTRDATNDTITVKAQTTAPGFFAKLFNIDSVTVRTTAAARSSAPSKAMHIAPITIGGDNPKLLCGAACYGQTTSLVALPTGSYGGNYTNFQLVDLSRNGGKASPATVATWLREGYNDYVSLQAYPGESSTVFNSSEFRQAMVDMFGKTIIVLIHSSANGNEGDAGALYNEVGWAAFVITNYTGSGAQGMLTGYFTSGNVDGLPGGNPTSSHGVHTIALVD
jgi:Flp pilus assembly protein TadG